MNVENLRTLAHELRADPESYAQEEWINESECGTVACIGGRAQLLSGGRDQLAATRWLGLTELSVCHLFVADPYWCLKHDFPYQWPAEYAERWEEAIKGRSGEAPAFVAADLLDGLADGKVKL